MKAIASLLKVSAEPRFPPGQGRTHFGSMGGHGEVFCWPTGRAGEVIGCYMHEFWLGSVPPVDRQFFHLYVRSLKKTKFISVSGFDSEVS